MAPEPAFVADVARPPPPPPPPPAGAVLVLFAEGREVDRVLGPRFLIGRGKHCDLIINSGKVSREHAAIIKDGNEFFMEDLGSSNGTWFEKKRITRRKIEDGDEYSSAQRRSSASWGDVAGFYEWAVDLVLATALIATVITDLRWRRIPDWITMPTALAGVILAGAAGGLGLLQGWNGIWSGPTWRARLQAPSSRAGSFLVLGLTGGFGGGDVKLMAALGAVFGARQVLGDLLFVAVAGGLQGVLAILAATRPGRAVWRAAGLRGADAPDFGKKLPYGLAIAAGTAVFRLWQHL